MILRPGAIKEQIGWSLGLFTYSQNDSRRGTQISWYDIVITHQKHYSCCYLERLKLEETIHKYKVQGKQWVRWLKTLLVDVLKVLQDGDESWTHDGTCVIWCNLRTLDHLKLDVILAESAPEVGVGNRLYELFEKGGIQSHFKINS